MTVAELIKHLETLDKNMRVLVCGYENGLDDPQISETDAVLDANWDGEKKRKGWDGRHDYADWDTNGATRVVLIGR